MEISTFKALLGNWRGYEASGMISKERLVDDKLVKIKRYRDDIQMEKKEKK